ncbi:DUF1453 domain-containing protein [Streptomyces sp. V4I2]|uniref:DUF1453 domain-containing protein n=1 Tax=Streptomyces sp. V4I2 TaxID=3042280 RepID=UPI002785EC6D|nr:DUF1453 domain-containing protein [Streptomyces sp. V4I2]MDQ1049141.1 hypothetical protein [Streptomyces sp. V4I2]
MPGLVDALMIVAVVVLVAVRQFRPGRIDTQRRLWLLPAVLAVIALREPHMVDAHHPAASVALLVTELITGLGIGAGWAWTTRIWVEPNGAVWSRSTKASGVVWVVGIGLRVGLFALGAALGIHQDSSALLLALAATLLVRSGMLARRAQSLHPAAVPGTAYGDRMPPPAWKERV